jgi:signal transduction histidine kinase
MLDINVVSFLVFDMLILGLLVSAFRDLKVQTKFHNYWRWALAFFAVAYLCFAIAPFVDRFIITPANMFLVSASLAQALLFRTWNEPVSKRLQVLLVLLVLVVGLAFEYLRQFGTFQQRVALIMGVVIASSLWHTTELWRLHRRESSFPVRLMLFFSALYFVLAVLRWVFVVYGNDPTHINLYNEEMVAFATRWGLMATDVLMYVAINQYYTEKSWQEEKQALEAQLNSQKIIDQLAHEVSHTTQLNQELALVLAEKNKLLTSLSSSMKSTRMGAMASTLAHEINQPLSAIRLNAEMVQGEIATTRDVSLVQTNLKYLIEDVDRIDGIVNKIKKFFYNDYSDFKDLSLSTLVDSSFDYVQEGCNKSNIDLLVNIDPELHIYGDKGQLQMVVFNLISNAMDALEETAGKRFITISAEQVGDHIDLIVQDNGSGVAPEVMRQIFDLFRTTKPDGMGVGLWLSRAVMDNHRGHLTYSTAPEGGARFVMQFPQPLLAQASAP